MPRPKTGGGQATTGDQKRRSSQSVRADVTVFGQVLGRDGQPGPGIGVTLAAEDHAPPFASSVTTSTGLFVLRFPAPPLGIETARRNPDPDVAAVLRLSSQTEAISFTLPSAPGVYGPIRIVAHKVLPRSADRFAPRPFTLFDERTLAKVLPAAPELFLGGSSAERAGGCGTTHPANVANRTYRHTQLLRLGSPDTSGVGADTVLSAADSVGAWSAPSELHAESWSPQVGYGLLATYRQDWWDLGRSLGDLLYTLPLAPGEETKIATVDWRRTDLAKRQTSLDESVRQDTSISRVDAIDDVVTIASEQKGKQTTDSNYKSGSASAGLSVDGFGASASGSAGSAHTVADIDDVNNATTQNAERINDSMHQASNTVRGTRSMAIAEVQQSEQASAATRVVRNHNHCHTLTIEYFQVLSHYLLRTQCEALTPVVLVPFEAAQIGVEWARANAPVLLSVLRDRSLALELQALLPHVDQPAPPVTASTSAATDSSGASTAGSASTTVESGASSGASGASGASGQASTSTGTGKVIVTFHVAAGWEFGGIVDLGRAGRVTLGTQSVSDGSGQYALTGTAGGGQFDYANVDFVALTLTGGLGATPWQGEVDHLEVLCENVGGGMTSFVRKDRASFSTSTAGSFAQPIESPTVFDAIPRPAAGSGNDVPAASDETAGGLSAALAAHLGNNAVYYSVAIINAGDGTGLARMLARAGLLDSVEARIVGYDGGRLAFPLRSTEPIASLVNLADDGTIILPEAVDESVITLPTPGVIAEAALGACPACERIDNTVFWDWMSSPIPEDAPDITAAMLASRAQNDTAMMTAQGSTLTPPAVQIPTEPTPPIQVGDATMSALVKQLQFPDPGSALSFLQGIAQAQTPWSAQGGQSSSSSPGSGQPSTGTSPPGTSGTGTATDATGVDAGASGAGATGAGATGAEAAGAGDLAPTAAAGAGDALLLA